MVSSVVCYFEIVQLPYKERHSIMRSCVAKVIYSVSSVFMFGFYGSVLKSLINKHVCSLRQTQLKRKINLVIY